MSVILDEFSSHPASYGPIKGLPLYPDVEATTFDHLPDSITYRDLFLTEDELLTDIRAGKEVGPRVGLIKITQELWAHTIIQWGRRFHTNFLVRSVCSLDPQPWHRIQARLQELAKLITIPSLALPTEHTLPLQDLVLRDLLNSPKAPEAQVDTISGKVVLAGGAIFSILFGEPINDLDLFYTGCDGKDTITHMEWLAKHYQRVTRASNVITFQLPHDRKLPEAQCVLQLFQSLSEVLLGFDVDCCGLGWDGTDLWMTPRAHHSFTHGINTVNLTRMATSYESRLLKYALRGMPIYVDEFDRGMVNESAIELLLEPAYYDLGLNLKGLDLLLWVDALTRRHDERLVTTIKKICTANTSYGITHVQSNTVELSAYFRHQLDRSGSAKIMESMRAARAERTQTKIDGNGLSVYQQVTNLVSNLTKVSDKILLDKHGQFIQCSTANLAFILRGPTQLWDIFELFGVLRCIPQYVKFRKDVYRSAIIKDARNWYLRWVYGHSATREQLTHLLYDTTMSASERRGIPAKVTAMWGVPCNNFGASPVKVSVSSGFGAKSTGVGFGGGAKHAGFGHQNTPLKATGFGSAMANAATASRATSSQGNM